MARAVRDAKAAAGLKNKGFQTRLDYTEPVLKDPLIRPVDPRSVRLQLQRRSAAEVARHPFWQQAQARLLDRFSYIRPPSGARFDHSIDLLGQPIDLAAGSLQLIWSVGLLAYLSDLRATLGFWSSRLAPSGLLMFVTFGPDTLRGLATALGDIAQCRHVPAQPDMHDIGDALVGLGMSDPVMDAEWLEFTYSTAESALADIRALGGNPLTGRPAGLSGRAWRGRVLQALEALRHAGRIRLRIECVFGHAWARDPQSRLKPDDPGQPRPIVWAPKNHRDP
jgi:SAM-dependent methyltransferase